MGESEAVGDAAVAVAKRALAEIDLSLPGRTDEKTHQHIGAVDLLPFYPLGANTYAHLYARCWELFVSKLFDFSPAFHNRTLEEAGRVANRVAQQLGRDLNIPILTYGSLTSDTNSTHLQLAKSGRNISSRNAAVSSNGRHNCRIFSSGRGCS